MSTAIETKAKLRELRQRLAVECPRAYTRADTPVELRQRMQSALESVSGACLLDASASSPATEEARDDALIQGHMALAEWERWLEQRKQPPAKRAGSVPLASIDRRRHERLETGVMVKLLRYGIKEGRAERMMVVAESANRPARNVSLGGIFVSLAKDELPQVGVGGIVHVSVSTAAGGASEFEIRASVLRRDEAGLALCWIQDSERAKRAVESLLGTIAKARRPI